MIRLVVPRESSATKNQALFSSKSKSKKIKCRLLQFLFGALRVKWKLYHYSMYNIDYGINRIAGNDKQS